MLRGGKNSVKRDALADTLCHWMREIYRSTVLYQAADFARDLIINVNMN